MLWEHCGLVCLNTVSVQSSPMSWHSKMAKCKPLNIQHVKQRKPAITAMQVPLALLPAHYSSVQHGYIYCSTARLCPSSANYRDFKLAPAQSLWDAVRLYSDTQKYSLWNAKHLALIDQTVDRSERLTASGWPELFWGVNFVLSSA